MSNSILRYANKFSMLLITVLPAANVFAGCSDNPIAHESDEIAVKVTGEGLEVFNKLDKSIYYFGVDQETAVVIFWAPVSKPDNKIDVMNKKSIPFSEIAGYKKEGNIIFNYWTSDDPSVKADVRNVVIKTGS